MHNLKVETLGIIGGLFLMIAFAEVASGRWKGRSFWYEINNLIGSMFLGVYAYKKHAFTSIALNIIWAVIALYTVLHVVHRHKVRRRKTRKSKVARRRIKR